MEIKTNKAKLIQCPQGHYYNAAVHNTCPICGESSVGTTAPADVTAPGGNGAFPHTMAPGDNADASSFGGTVPVYSRDAVGLEEPFGHTVIGGDLSADNQAEPVVGWLVCIEGPVRGTDFRIHAGYNYIGREEGDIHIHSDQQISRRNHAMIAFDSSDQSFYVGPSAGRNLIKVNGKAVINAVEIKNYDVISIGTTKLMFVALCGENFRWNKEPSNG